MKRPNFGTIAALIALSSSMHATVKLFPRPERTAPSLSSDPVRESVECLIKPLVEENMISGAILIARGGDILYAEGFGRADREHGTPNTTRTPFRLASVSKSITAVAALQLADKGLLKLDSTLESFLPGFPNGDHITIEHLLSHRSGIPSDVYLPGFREKSLQGISLEEAVDWIKKEARPNSGPGERFDYSNSGYLLLSAIIEKASGMPFEEYLARNVFSVADMKSSGLDSAAKLLPGRARGYTRTDRGDVMNSAYRDPSYGWGYGALYATVGDLFRFDRALANGRLLSNASRRAMWTSLSDTPWKNRYGLGWFIDDLEGEESATALGATGGFVATLRHFTAQDVVVVILMNHDFMLFRELFDQVSRIALGKPWKPLFEPASRATRSSLASFAGIYEMEDGTLLEFRSLENRLEFGFKGSGPMFEIHVISDGTGYVAAQNALLRFRKTNKGGIELSALYGNLAWNGRRISGPVTE